VSPTRCQGIGQCMDPKLPCFARPVATSFASTRRRPGFRVVRALDHDYPTRPSRRGSAEIRGIKTCPQPTQLPKR
jgi:hypothetical protein